MCVLYPARLSRSGCYAACATRLCGGRFRRLCRRRPALCRAYVRHFARVPQALCGATAGALRRRVGRFAGCARCFAEVRATLCSERRAGRKPYLGKSGHGFRRGIPPLGMRLGLEVSGSRAVRRPRRRCPRPRIPHDMLGKYVTRGVNPSWWGTGLLIGYRSAHCRCCGIRRQTKIILP